MTAHEEALRLNRLVRNLLDMTRLEAGALKVQKELQPLEEVVGAALDRMEDRLRGREVEDVDPRRLAARPVRRDPDRAGAHQLARERDEVLAGRHADRDSGAGARRRGRGRGRRSGPGIPPAGRRARLRQVLSRARGRGRRRRPRAHDLPRHRRARTAAASGSRSEAAAAPRSGSRCRSSRPPRRRASGVIEAMEKEAG